jgi:hypothetical protein
MRKSENTLKACGFAAVLMVTAVVGHAQVTPPIALADLGFYTQLDESGHGAVIGAGSVLGYDPFPLTTPYVGSAPIVTHDFFPGGGNTLRYALPVTDVTSGDLLITDAGGATSDLIRWEAGYVFFYSLAGGGTMADSIIPSNLQGNHVSVSEAVLAGGEFGALWEPLPGQPGFVPEAGTSTFGWNIISEVPEPSSFALLGLAGGLGVLLRKRR